MWYIVIEWGIYMHLCTFENAASLDVLQDCIIRHSTLLQIAGCLSLVAVVVWYWPQLICKWHICNITLFLCIYVSKCILKCLMVPVFGLWKHVFLLWISRCHISVLANVRLSVLFRLWAKWKFPLGCLNAVGTRLPWKCFQRWSFSPSVFDCSSNLTSVLQGVIGDLKNAKPWPSRQTISLTAYIFM